MKTASLLVAVGGLALAGGAQAAPISVNFAGGNGGSVDVVDAAGVGVVNDTAWANVDNRTTSSVSDVDGSTVDVAWSDTATWSTDVTDNTTGARQLYGGRFDTQTDLTIDITDISASMTGSYDLIVYYALNSDHEFDMTVGGTTVHINPLGQDDASVDGYLGSGPSNGTDGSMWHRFTGLSGDTQQIATSNREIAIGIVGFQIVDPIPEPGSLALLSLGGLALVRRRRG